MFCGEKKIDDEELVETARGHFLMPGMVVRLRCHNTGKNLRLKKEDSDDPIGISSNGGDGGYAKWIVHEGKDHKKAIRLQNVKHNDRWLRITDDGISNAGGTGGSKTEFIVQYRGPCHVSLACARKKKWHVGFNGDGDLKKASDTGEGKGGWFYFTEVHRLVPGMTVYLKHVKSGGNLRISDEPEVDLKVGAEGKKARWVVEDGGKEYANGTIKLRNVKFDKRYLRIKDGAVNAGGDGGGKTVFIAINFGKKRLSLRSFDHQDQHIGATPDGEIKKAKNFAMDGPKTWFEWSPVADE